MIWNVNTSSLCIVMVQLCYSEHMITSSNGGIFCVTGLLSGNSPVIGEFPSQRPVTRSFDVFFNLRLDKRLSKQWRGWWFETPTHPLWRNVMLTDVVYLPIASLYCQLRNTIAPTIRTSNGSWCMGIKGEMSGTVCVTFVWDMYIYMSCL